MKTIKRLLELRFQAKLSQIQVARSLGCGKTTVVDYEKRAIKYGLSDYATIQNFSEEELLIRLGLNSDSVFSSTPLRKDKFLPEWSSLHQELGKKHVTLALLWSEYREEHSAGYSYSQFCEHYRRWQQKLSVVLRQEHKAGEKVFVDYAGTTIGIVDLKTGEIKASQIFVGVLGASSYTFVEATWTQTLPDWLISHRRMLEFFFGVPQILVPDNLKSGITKPDRYEADVNRSYQEFAEHYGTCVIPARSRKPRDKAKAEAGVLVASRWIIAALRSKIFHSLEDLNEAIVPLLERINNKKMRYVNKSRKELFEDIDRPALGTLRQTPYQYAEWKKARVNIDYHIVYHDHFYSVCYQLVKQVVHIRATALIIEIFYKSKRIASHHLSFKKGGYTTDPNHRPPSHQAHLKWTPERIINWGKSKGDNVGLYIESLITSKAHPEQGYRAALGVIRLADKYNSYRLNQACGNAIAIGVISYQTVKNMLKNGMDQVAPPSNKKTNEKQQDFFTSNENVRGRNYYH